MYTRRIKYDYKIRMAWGKARAPRQLPTRLLRAAVAPLAFLVLAGMASSELANRDLHWDWTKLFERPDPTAENVFRLPGMTVLPAAVTASPAEALRPATPAADSSDSGSYRNAIAPPHAAIMDPVYGPEGERPGRDGSGTRAAEGDDPGTDGGGSDSFTGPDWQTVQVRNGDNLAVIFARLGLSRADLDRIVNVSGATADLKKLNIDDHLHFRIKDGTLQELVHRIDLGHTLHVRNRDGAFNAETIVEPLEIRQNHVTVTIHDSLFESGQNAGLSDAMIMKLADIFGYDIDFVLDLRDGDHFTVVYEEIYKKGEKLKDGAIIAAEFVNGDKVYRGVRYDDGGGHSDYFTPDGHALRKAFLRTPVAFTRITSYFSLARKHPILNTIRAHRGVDYAAPIGTPVKAVGDARVVSAGWMGGYGKVVMLQHASGYLTVYGHLSAFAKNTRAGAAVRQGQTIGYVGMTGLATGPHLHYEFRVNGVHRDPLKIALPKAMPIPAAQLAEFRDRTRPLLSRLDDAVASERRAVAATAAPTGSTPNGAAETIAAAPTQP